MTSDRKSTWEAVEHNSAILHAWLMHGAGSKMARALGLVLEEAKPTVYRTGKSENRVAVEVHSVRWALRRGPRGEAFTDLVVEVTQRRRGYFDKTMQEQMDAPGSSPEPGDDGDFKYRAGCTLLIDPKNMQVRRVIRTRGDINDDVELDRMRKFLTGGLEPTDAFGAAQALHAKEPFALLHREQEV